MPAGHSSVRHNPDGSRFVLKSDPALCKCCCFVGFCAASTPLICVDCIGHCVWRVVLGKSCKDCRGWKLICGCPVRTLDGYLGDNDADNCYECCERDRWTLDAGDVEVVVAPQPPRGTKIYTDDDTGRKYWWDGKTGQKNYLDVDEEMAARLAALDARISAYKGTNMAPASKPASTYLGKRWNKTASGGWDSCASSKPSSTYLGKRWNKTASGGWDSCVSAPTTTSMERDGNANSDSGVTPQVDRTTSQRVNRDHEEEPPVEPPMEPPAEPQSVASTPVVVAGEIVAGDEGDTRPATMAAWLEDAGIASTDATTYAVALVELGVDSPSDLRMLTDTEWPALIKPLHLRKIQDALAKSKM